MEKVDKIIINILYFLLALLMLIMVVVVSIQVISRYVFGSPFTWTEEIGRYTFVWITLLGMSLAVKKGGHIALDILLKKMSGKIEKVLYFLINTFIAVFGMFFTISGFKMMKLGIGQNSPSLAIPMEIVYIVMPISGILIIYFVISNIVQNNGERKTIG